MTFALDIATFFQHNVRAPEQQKILKASKNKIIVTTEKDYGRLSPLINDDKLYYIKISLDFIFNKEKIQFDKIILDAI